MSDVVLTDAADRVLVYLYEVDRMNAEPAASGDSIFAALPDLHETTILDAIDELIGHGFIGHVADQNDV